MSAPTLVNIVSLTQKTDGIYEELKDAQRRLGFLPAAELERIALQRNLHFRDIHAIASYYPHFRLQSPAKVEVKVCDDMTCHLRGSRALQQNLQQKFQEISKENLVIGNVSCLGRCDQAPVLAINGCYYDSVSSDTAIPVVQQALAAQTFGDENGSPSPQILAQPSRKLETDPYDGQRSYAALRKFVTDFVREPKRAGDLLLQELELAGLRGLGGAGFPTFKKWYRVRGWPSEEKYFVCNADESEPGTIKDRFILTHLPYLVIEGMILGGLCVGAKQGYLYIRHEYKDQIAILDAELEQCQRERLIGPNILETGLSFHLKLFVSPGGYICGEESALLEAIEGKRAEPRNRPPLLVDQGLWGKPTVVNNVETLTFAAAIAGRGSHWFNSYGTNGARGLKFVGISGDVRQPGIYEVPMGIKFKDLIYGEQYGRGLRDGHELLAFAPSGPSSGYLPASAVDLPMDWKPLENAGSMLGSSAIVVCSDRACMLDMALNAVRFYRNESCGKCVPCRIGSQQMVQILERWTRGDYQKTGHDQKTDHDLVKELSHALKQASICGLGQVVPAPIASVLKYFPEEVDGHFLHRHCRAGICFAGERR